MMTLAEWIWFVEESGNRGSRFRLKSA